MPERSAGDTGAVILGWLMKLVIGLAVVFVVCFDGISVATTHFNVEDDANSAASAASANWVDNRSAADALAAAISAATQRGDTVMPGTFSITSAGVARIELRRHAKTILLGRLGPLAKWTVATSYGQATEPS